MPNSQLGGMSQSRCGLSDQMPHHTFGQRMQSPGVLVGILAVDIFHREEQPPLMPSKIIGRDDVRVQQFGDRLRLLLEARQHRRIARLTDENRLQRDDAIQHKLLGAIDDSHPAMAQHRQDLVAGNGFHRLSQRFDDLNLHWREQPTLQYERSRVELTAAGFLRQPAHCVCRQQSLLARNHQKLVSGFDRHGSGIRSRGSGSKRRDQQSEAGLVLIASVPSIRGVPFSFYPAGDAISLPRTCSVCRAVPAMP
jgi:hypothetical protein